MKYILIGVSFFLVVFCSSTKLLAQDSAPKIAVVDMVAVFKAHPKTAIAEAALEAKKKAAREVFQAKKKKLEEVLRNHQAVTQKLVAAGSSASSSDKAAAKAHLDEATKIEKEIATLRTTQATELKTNFVTERRQILEDISAAIAKFNASGKYALILDRSARSANGIPQVVHSPGTEDITAQITALVKASKP